MRQAVLPSTSNLNSELFFGATLTVNLYNCWMASQMSSLTECIASAEARVGAELSLSSLFSAPELRQISWGFAFVLVGVE